MDLKYVQTTCPYCGTGCSFNLVVKDGKVVGTAPYHRSPAKKGKDHLISPADIVYA